MGLVDGVEAVVLRTIRYGEADVIAHVFTQDGGRRGVIAKGARRAKSRLGARIEPFLALRLQLHEGRGDLATVRGVEVVAAHERLRSSWRAQQVGAAALDLVTRLSVEHEENEPLYHLLRRFLALLDQICGPDADAAQAAALLVAFELKLLHVIGMAPQLDGCVRCGDSGSMAAYSAHDGGVVCAGCRVAGDLALDAAVHAAAIELMRAPLADIAAREADALPSARALRSVGSGIVAATCVEHAGVRPRTPWG